VRSPARLWVSGHLSTRKPRLLGLVRFAGAQFGAQIERNRARRRARNPLWQAESAPSRTRSPRLRALWTVWSVEVRILSGASRPPGFPPGSRRAERQRHRSSEVEGGGVEQAGVAAEALHRRILALAQARRGATQTVKSIITGTDCSRRSARSTQSASRTRIVTAGRSGSSRCAVSTSSPRSIAAA
jgi:hypothetical protein